MGNWPKVQPRRIRVITCDITGTLVSFRGTLEQHYLGAAEKMGLHISDATKQKIGTAFNRAYRELSRRYPCFGSDQLSAKEWWKLTVLRSFELAQLEFPSPHEQEAVFSRIYSTFGSLRAYERFEDSLPFLHWAGQRHHLICGVLSNADERYGDSILPMLGMTHDELHFQLFSKELGLEKPHPQFFAAALQHAEPFLFDKEDPLMPGQCLHIGNDYTKDFEGARHAGMHAVLLDRYGEDELAQEWKRRGALVFNDLMDVVLWLGRSGCQLG